MCNKKKELYNNEKFENTNYDMKKYKWVIPLIILVLIIIVLYGFMQKDRKPQLFMTVPRNFFTSVYAPRGADCGY